MTKYIKWDFTHKCNLRCIHCLAGKNYFTPDVHTISIAEKFSIVDNLASADVRGITFLGGEPTARKDLFPVAKYAASKGIDVTIVTNGTLLNDTRIAKALDAGVRNITVSMDGASGKTHDQIRGKGSFQKTFENLERLISKLTNSTSCIRIKINTVVNRINCQEVEAMFELGRQLGVNELSFLALSEIGRAPDHKDKLALTSEEMIDVAVAIGRKFNAIKKKEYPTITQQIAYPLVCDYILQKYGIEMPGSNVSNICCFGAISLGYVTPDGYLFPCDRIVSENFIGNPIRGATVERRNLLTHSFDDIWNSAYFAKMFELVVDEDTYNNYEPCSSCKYMKSRQCNPCPLYSMRSDVSIGPCLIAHRSMIGNQCDAGADLEASKIDSVFSGFSTHTRETNFVHADFYADLQNTVPKQAAGIRSFNKNGAAVIYNPQNAECCRLQAMSKFMWDLANGENSVKDIACQVESVIAAVRKRLGAEKTEDHLDDVIKRRVAGYYKELNDAGFISMGQVN